MNKTKIQRIVAWVAQTSSRLCRRIPFGRPPVNSQTQKLSNARGLEIRDTAGWKPALHMVAAGSLLGLAAVALLVAGCRTSHTEHAGSGKPGAVVQVADSGKGGAQLWAQNCVRCHNVRSPSIYSDAEWEVSMHHMRIRANLTSEEHRKILEFLKSAN